ncbi:MAG: ABC transporter permease [Treponema sp.]|jgi:peptide/nickel transport system permease protein|nr:ABC transporter permease [Treponema sp.]
MTHLPGKKIIAHVFSALPVLFVVSLIVFGMSYLVPGNEAALLLGEASSQEDIALLENRLQLREPPPLLYLRWLGNMLRGNFGLSTANSVRVSSLITGHLFPTFSLAFFSLCIALAVSLPLGMLAAGKRDSLADRGLSTLALLGISLPGFLLGLLLMMIFAVRLRWFPVAAYRPLSSGLLPHLRSIALPAFSLGLIHAGLLMRLIRASLLDELGKSYVGMARAKGAGEIRILLRHAFRNILSTLISPILQSFTAILSGAAVIESLFGIPGLGSLLAASIGRRDFLVIRTLVLLAALLNVILNLCGDLIIARVDPRVRFGED